MKNVLIAALTALTAMTACTADKQPAYELLPRENFQSTIDGKQTDLYTLTNANGLALQVTNYGARVPSIWIPGRDGQFADVVFGHSTLQGYTGSDGERFLGAAIGRFGNRIADGKFTLNDTEYTLATYNNGQCLHGGIKGFDRVVWDVKSVNDSSIHFSYLSPDMEEGFPGNLQVDMIYTLTSDNAFRVEYHATTDKDTHVNLTHHSFFNLKGNQYGTINDHMLCIAADQYTPVNEVLIPFGQNESVEGTPFDFRTPTTIGSRLDQENVQFTNCRGYDHNFVLNRKSTNGLEFAASVLEPASGRYMEVWTTEPGLQFYGGNFFDGTSTGKGVPLRFRESFALETQHFPDTPNQPAFPSTILKPGEKYHHICEYRFSTK